MGTLDKDSQISSLLDDARKLAEYVVNPNNNTTDEMKMARAFLAKLNAKPPEPVQPEPTPDAVRVFKATRPGVPDYIFIREKILGLSKNGMWFESITKHDDFGPEHPENVELFGDAKRDFLEKHPLPATVAEKLPPVQDFQPRVKLWMDACFGPVISTDKTERNHRFLEESLELVQAIGCTKSEAQQLVEYVYDRPWGEPKQEAGGVMVTLAALCLANGMDMQAVGEAELARVWTKIDKIRAKQAAKPPHSPLPVPPAPVAGKVAEPATSTVMMIDPFSGHNSGLPHPRNRHCETWNCRPVARKVRPIAEPPLPPSDPKKPTRYALEECDPNDPNVQPQITGLPNGKFLKLVKIG